MKRLSLFVSLLLIASQAFAEPVQLNPPTQDKRVIIPLQGKWGPNVSAYNLGVGNYTTLKNLRYSDAGLETVDGYSKITTNVLGSGATMVSGFQFAKPGISEVVTKYYTGSYYVLAINPTAIPGTGDYTTVITTDTYYETFTLASGPGSFTDLPYGLMAYADGTQGVLIYGSTGVEPVSMFITDDGAVPIGNISDVTEDSKNEQKTFTYNSATHPYLYIGLPWLVKSFYVDVGTPNASASTLTLNVYNLTTWSAKGITDGTSSGGISLAQDGTIALDYSGTYPSNLVINNQQLYWYRFALSAGSAVIKSITAKIPVQRITDTWNGSGRTCIGLHVNRDGEFEDYTYQVANKSTVDAPFAATVGGMDSTDYIDFIFEEPVQGVQLGMLGSLVNKTSAQLSGFFYWNGTAFTAISGEADGTYGSTGTLAKSGTIAWDPITAEKPHDAYGVYGYHYRLYFTGDITDAVKEVTSTAISFDNATSTIAGTGLFGDFEAGDTIKVTGSTDNNGTYTIQTVDSDAIVVYSTLTTEGAGDTVNVVSYNLVDHDGTSIDTVYGITSPVYLRDYNLVGNYAGRAMLIDGNRVDYSLPDTPWVFNGVNTSNRGAPNEAPLYFGDIEPITATKSLSNRYGSNIIQVWVVTKNSETYSLSGSQPYSDFSEPFVIRKMSSNIGCPAPMTIAEVQVQLEDIQRNGLMWLDSTGPVIFDGAVVSTVSGIENYFDPSKSEYIKTSLIEKATAYYDSTHYEYNLLIPSGSAATANNVWLVYDLKEKKWFKKVPASYPVYTIPVEDTDGIKYSYGHLSSGHLMRLDNGATWDGTFIDQQITTGIFSPPVVDEIGFWSRSKIRGIKLLPGNDANDAVLLLHMNGTDASTTFTDDSKSSHTVTANSDSQLDTAAYKYGTASGLFDGTDDYISAADSADWDISTDWTIDAWVKHTDYTGNEAYVSQYEDASNSWVFYHNQSTYGLRFLVWSGGLAIVTVNQTAGSKITDSNWHHVAVVKVANEYGLYLDGAQVGYVSDTDTDTFAGILTVGSKGSGDDFFDGHIDDIRIYQKNIFTAKPNSGNTDTITSPDSGIYGYATISLYHDGSLSTQTQLVALDEDGVDVSDLYGGKNFAQQGNFFQVDISATTRYSKWNPLTWGYKAQFIRED